MCSQLLHAAAPATLLCGVLPVTVYSMRYLIACSIEQLACMATLNLNSMVVVVLDHPTVKFWHVCHIRYALQTLGRRRRFQKTQFVNQAKWLLTQSIF
jgi:hypothetical protein